MWCKGAFGRLEGPTHEYMQSTPGCWASLGRVLAREYEGRGHIAVHRLAVDPDAVQHPVVGRPRRSVDGGSREHPTRESGRRSVPIPQEFIPWR